jgi:hypothetical protein
VCIPLGIVASTYNWGPVPVFLLVGDVATT